eukprot:7528276-Pyramimonas_sp.AAC.1
MAAQPMTAKPWETLASGIDRATLRTTALRQATVFRGATRRSRRPACAALSFPPLRTTRLPRALPTP